jgi:hypothetical protein
VPVPEDPLPDPTAPRLLVGPLLRYVDESRATLWVEVDQACTVVVRTPDGGPRSRTPTWSVHGHHYAIVVLEGLEPGTATPYEVRLDAGSAGDGREDDEGVRVWPPSGSPYPPSTIRTLDGEAGTFRLSFGSCRRSAPYDAAGLRRYGADALVALAGRMVADDPSTWPDALLLAGDQVYADEPSAAMAVRIRNRNAGRLGAEQGRDLADDDPAVTEEISDFEEYTWLYQESWNVPGVRWLLSTVPSAMLLDDHDLRDDWNTSTTWREQVTGQHWWRDRVVGAFGSYWVYQHLGNLSPDDLAADDLLRALRRTPDPAERDRLLDDFAWRSDADPGSARWSFTRDVGSAGQRVRLLAVDSRCSRRLEPGRRAMVDDAEWDWLVQRAACDDGRPPAHLLVATTLPLLMLRGIHHLEGWNEAVAEGVWGRRAAQLGERARQGLDLEHWSAFRTSMDRFVALLADVASGPDAPASVLVLSGDVHCSYTAQARLEGVPDGGSAVHQLVMSPFRNPLHLPLKLANRLLERRWLRIALHRLARWAGVADPAVDWRIDHGPWFSNGVMTVTLSGREAGVEVAHAEVVDGEQRLRTTLTLPLTPPIKELPADQGVRAQPAAPHGVQEVLDRHPSP